jgi:hypothetical protein
LHGGLPAGREDVREKEKLLVGNTVGHLLDRRIGERHPQVLGLAARIPAGEMRVSEQARGSMAEHLIGEVLLAVTSLAHGEVTALALVALTADDGEGHYDPIALLQFSVDRTSCLDDFAHGLVAQDVAGKHGGNEVVKQVQIRAADRAARDFDDDVAPVFDFRIGDSVAADIFLPMPNQRSHSLLLPSVVVRASAMKRCGRFGLEPSPGGGSG